ncbi:MAG: hypothetical protein IPJ78_02585 [Gemmatimonadetes bacterium]|nr:hypothetical protein [Gemmatimonadota bacterium]
MQRSQFHVGQSLRQVQQFLTVHANAVPAAVASAAKRTLDAAVAELDRAATEQGSLARAVRGEVQRRIELERTLLRKYVTPLLKFARASLRGTPEFASITPSTRALERERLVQTALAMAVAAEKHVEALSAAEFPADYLEQLRSAAAAVQRSFDAGTSGRVRKTGVTSEIRGALTKGRQAVATLDALVMHTIVGNEALEAEWRSAKRVRRIAATEQEVPAAA